MKVAEFDGYELPLSLIGERAVVIDYALDLPLVATSEEDLEEGAFFYSDLVADQASPEELGDIYDLPAFVLTPECRDIIDELTKAYMYSPFLRTTAAMRDSVETTRKNLNIDQLSFEGDDFELRSHFTCAVIFWLTTVSAVFVDLKRGKKLRKMVKEYIRAARDDQDRSV